MNAASSQRSAAPWHMIIVVPAHNEEALVARCLQSVARARAALPAGITTQLVVALDACSDNTARHTRRWLRRGDLIVALNAHCVGSARAHGVSEALSSLRTHPLDRCWIANTDADCIVPRTWLHHQLIHAGRHAQAVTGTVDVDSFAEHDAGVPARFRDSYVRHGDGTHPHVHGANLGTRADSYLLAGGWKHQPTAEDHDLWGRLQASGAVCVADASLCVVTSGRRIGRAPSGFAGALAAHNTLLHEPAALAR